MRQGNRLFGYPIVIQAFAGGQRSHTVTSGRGHGGFGPWIPAFGRMTGLGE